jgi:hypothetical protein
MFCLAKILLFFTKQFKSSKWDCFEDIKEKILGISSKRAYTKDLN